MIAPVPVHCFSITSIEKRKRTQNLRGDKMVWNENVNYWSSGMARDAMPEPVVIDLDLADDDSLTGKASENENEICLAMK